MFKACVLEFQGSWDDLLPLIEFSYNNILHSSIEMMSFDALYGRQCRLLVRWFKDGEMDLLWLYDAMDAMEKVILTREKSKMSQSWKKSYFDVRRKDLKFNVVD